jgi:flagellar motor switch protein FliG
MPYDRTDRIRRAAILVASLDDALAEQVLRGLPPGVRDRVLDVAESLDEIDPEEQRDVLTEFRRLSRGGPSRGGEAVEATFSSGDQPGRDHGARDAIPSATQQGDAMANDGLSDADAAAMAELLANEHPQIVAAALSRLSEAQSASVFAALPAEIQAETLERLADLAPADESAVDEVASQIHQHMQQRRERQARAAAGAELVQKILSRTPAAQRSVLLARMAAKDAIAPAPQAQPAPRSGERRPAPRPMAPRPEPVAQQAQMLVAAMHRTSTLVAEPMPLEDRSAEFGDLSDAALVAGLQAADETTVLRALAASGEGLLARVTAMLPRRQSKQLRRMLNNLGPTRLAELQAAQHRLLELALEAADKAREAAA